MDLQGRLEKILPIQRIKTKLIDRLSYAADAGFYYLVPKAVVQPETEAEISGLFALANETNIPLVFRAGGTSLSGQSITDGILVDISQRWNRISPTEQGRKVCFGPGITGSMVNTHLKTYRQKIGPDPSSIQAAQMGGILSNNASGMCCGVKLNAYHTLHTIRFILPNGKSYSTGLKEDYSRFEKECPALQENFLQIHNQIKADSALFDRIRHKYKTKNTVGYSLNSFIDFDHPLDMLAHLLIGAEGTLAFIAEATLHTVPDLPCKSTALIFFKDIYNACVLIEPLVAAGASMVELMDRASLTAVQDLKGVDPLVKQLPASAAALLVEFEDEDETGLTAKVNGFLSGISAYPIYRAPSFTSDNHERELLWKMRKGLFPAVGAVRARGTTVVLEDIAFPLPVLGQAIFDLQQLFRKYQYDNAIIFGHAKDGNIHFVVTQSFKEAAEVDRYDAFMREVVDLVVKKYDGTLKAEHGTGRNMAPFVETEWQGEAYEIMKRIKALIDPKNILNPGVIINEDKAVHIKNLKQLPEVEEEVDKCIECGFCEPVCPSRNLTLTPRRRIMVRRELKKLELAGKGPAYNSLLEEYQYAGLETCAVDGLCAGACPVDINTGDLIKRLRRESHSPAANKIALTIAKNFGLTVKLARTGLKAGMLLNSIGGNSTMTRITASMRKWMQSLPQWNAQLSKPPSLAALKVSVKAAPGKAEIIYFPSCISRVLGAGLPGKPNIMETFIQVCEKTGFGVQILKNAGDACCGQIFSSKGFQPALKFAANSIVETLWESSDKGKRPIVIDLSSCAYTLLHLRPQLPEDQKEKYDRLVIMDAVDFLHDMVLPDCRPLKKMGKVAIHPVCSLEKMGTKHKLSAIAHQFAEEVILPKAAGCCGMAGDRGFLYPELTASATLPESLEVKSVSCEGYYSSTKTCEMAMSAAVNKEYESILYLVNECL